MRRRRTTRRLLQALACALPCTSATAQAPDVVASEIGESWSYYGQAEGTGAYSFSVRMCNIGSLPLAVEPYFDMPLVGHNVYRVANGRIEQLGYGFLSQRVCALSQAGCGTCLPTPCATLGTGCSDTSLLHDGAFGWAKWAIDANRGEWEEIPPGPSGAPEVMQGRIRLDLASLSDEAALYVAEGQMISGHDQQLGHGGNNASWREVTFSGPTTPTSIGPTYVGDPAIFAWKLVHADVRLVPLTVRDEGGPGVDGLFWLGSRATDLGDGTWRYDYAVQNLSSERAARGLVLDTPCGAVPVTSPGFSGVRHHSGSPYADTAWRFTASGSGLRWTTSTFASDPNANALRWGNLFAFSVESSAAPRTGTARLLLFEGAGQLFGSACVPGTEPCPTPLPPTPFAGARTSGR